VPDIGGLRRRLADQAKQVAQQASQVGLQHIEQFSANLAPPTKSESDEAEESASESDVAEEVSRLRSFLASRRPPPGPVQGRWSIGIGDLIAEHPRVPAAARGLVRNLDRYGGLAITESTIEFDHDAIEWASVTELRTRNVVEYLLSDALIQQIGTLPLPWFPGRRRVLDALSKALLTMVIAAAREQLDRHADIRIPAEVQYRGTVRRNRQLSPGILAALVMADPAVNECIVATAGAHGIAVRSAGDDALSTADQRADTLRAKLGALESKYGRRSGASGSPVAVSVSPSDTANPPSSPRVVPSYDLPDQGEALIRLARGIPGQAGAEVVAAEVARVRRPGGVLARADLQGMNSKDGPAQLLRGLLEVEAITVGTWAQSGFGITQRRSVGKQVEDMCREGGATAGVQWALANGNPDRLHIQVLRDMLAGVMDSMPGGAAFMRTRLSRSFKKWK
jgi:hypothetical protein